MRLTPGLTDAILSILAFARDDVGAVITSVSGAISNTGVFIFPAWILAELNMACAECVPPDDLAAAIAFRPLLPPYQRPWTSLSDPAVELVPIVDESGLASALSGVGLMSSAGWRVGWAGMVTPAEPDATPSAARPVDGLVRAMRWCRVQTSPPPSDAASARSFHVEPSAELAVGTTVAVLASPFAALCPAVFADMQLAGSVAALLPVASVAGIIDARLQPGAEGGILLSPEGHVVGITLAPLLPPGLAALELFPFVGTGPLLALLTGGTPRRCRPLLAPPPRSLPVVKVRCGDQYGSGIVVRRAGGRTAVVTNAHVVADADAPVTLAPHPYTATAAVAASRLAPSPDGLDVTWLKPAAELGLRPISLANRPLVRGQRVVVVGFPVLEPMGPRSLGPVTTSGTITQVWAESKQSGPALVLVDAAVHRGNSGGALLDAATGDLIGLVTSNLSSGVLGTRVHVGFILPIHAAYASSASPAARKAWCLDPTLPSKL
ncbi:peroxisomal leader peptide-processing protease [Thecamonas trahens ATCC 50062]|uniref:Peroxisomal leader peptide-processing protease n=1 Tax=Thecamonas trahens ATCC 50062 TaxID=461836 RepID=A0A0L0DFR3_THETB|nr:peroxisomal leader peptide-processing protease [Thecamonas trahens ATCC 50062]KNC50153.1 peroxisomal leader peptide-processing protease [Thecamonas trahens ATCC 50062]|eukprot:XP_013756999.1 peroxisomal leader peptide-processing protease [Thecamonas trahens ATCC 50062]